MKSNHISNIILYIALGILAIYAGFWALYSIGEIMFGNFGGMIYLLPTALIAGLMYVSFKRPLVGGAASLLAGLALFVRFYLVIDQPEDKLSAALVIGGPFILAGLLLLVCAALSRSRSADPSGA